MFLNEFFDGTPILGSAASFLGVINPSALAFLGERRPLLTVFKAMPNSLRQFVVLVEVEILMEEVVPGVV